MVIVLSVFRVTASDYPCGIVWSLCCLSFVLRLLITPVVSFGHCVVCSTCYGFWLPLWYRLVIVLSVRRVTASDYLFGIVWWLCCLSFVLRLLITSLVSFGHCVVCPSCYGFWLPLWYRLAIGQTTQGPNDTKEVIRSRNTKDRQHNDQTIQQG
jgi:uncharacterized membrane protein